ncbi:MAG: hypothetical protein IJ740_13755 [Ruminococcus sp.]|nr:hypothetical protein [Ruminococcus sp.]
MNDMSVFTNKQRELIDSLMYLPVPDDTDYEEEFIKQQREGMIICIMLDAIQCNCVDEVLEIVRNNSDKTVFDIMKNLVKKGIGSSVEIVDDDELDEDD